MRKISKRSGKGNGRYVHGMNKHKLNRVFGGMLARCNNPNHKAYKYYGARGIKVCDEWVDDRTLFFKWAFDNGWKEGLQVDRKDNDSEYSPTNCRIVTRLENTINRRNTIFVEYRGETKPLFIWCKILSIDYDLVKDRFKRGKSPEQMFFKGKYNETQTKHQRRPS